MRKEILEPFCFMKNLVQKLTVAAVAVMPIILCGCPGDNCVDENDPKGFVVKMKNDYSDKVFVRMSINSINWDTSFCCPRTDGHTLKITDEYYDLHCHPYDAAAYTSIDSEDWDESMQDSISKYVIGIHPFEEVYAYYKSYSIEELKNIIEHNELNKFERLK